MKYAVLESGGKQYIAREGEVIEIDRLSVEVGNSIDFKDVLLVVENTKVHVGSPYVKGAKVRGTVVEQFKAPKVIIFKYIPKERYRRKLGHRQRYTRVTIDKITLTTPRSKSAAEEAAEKPKKITSKAKIETTKPIGSKKTETTKSTTAKKSTTRKTTAGSKAKGAQPKSSTKAKSSKASTKPKDKATDNK